MTSTLQSPSFEVRRRRARKSDWPLGVAAVLMVLGNAALWGGLYAISHGYVTVDPRFFSEVQAVFSQTFPWITLRIV